jgi:parallel beta-helix repeat protein
MLTQVDFPCTRPYRNNTVLETNQKMKKTVPISLAAFLVIVGSVVAKDLAVPKEYKTIQAAIDVAAKGDTVIVADGTYTGPGNCNINFKGKAITLYSKNGPEKCIIDCQGGLPRRQRLCGFIFRKGEDANSVVDGFTISHGYCGDGSSYGRCGAIECRNSSPTIANCIIRDNYGTAGGGVLCINSGSPVITNCIIIANKAKGGFGGGICCYARSSPRIIDCTIAANSADRGGGIYCDYKSCPVIINCNISGNVVHQSGGGLYCSQGSSPAITNCIISGNWSHENSSGLFCRNKANPRITNCTICDNEGQESGGGIVCWDSAPKITNCILWGNLPNEIFLISGSPVVSYCDIRGGWQGEGNIDANPFFVMDGNDAITGTWAQPSTESSKANRATAVDSSASFTEGELVGELICLREREQYRRPSQSFITNNTATSIETICHVGNLVRGEVEKGEKYRLIDYYLEPDSPCIDAGTAEGAPETDIEGSPRSGLKPDIGAFEAGY